MIRSNVAFAPKPRPSWGWIETSRPNRRRCRPHKNDNQRPKRQRRVFDGLNPEP